MLVFSTLISAVCAVQWCVEQRLWMSPVITVVLNTHGTLTENDQIPTLVRHYGSELPGAEILVSWNNAPRDALAFVCADKSDTARVGVTAHATNLLSSRFAVCANQTSATGVLLVDNDVFIPGPQLRSAVRLFRDSFADRIVGFYGASIGTKRDLLSHYSSSVEHYPGDTRFMLTGAAIVARRLCERYFSNRHASHLRDLAEEMRSGEDLLFNAIAVNETEERGFEATTHRDAFCISCKKAGRVHHAIMYDDYLLSKRAPGLRRLSVNYQQQAGVERLTDMQYYEAPNGTRVVKRLYMIEQILNSFHGVPPPVPWIFDIGFFEQFAVRTLYGALPSESVIHLCVLTHSKESQSLLERALRSVLAQNQAVRAIWLCVDGRWESSSSFIRTLCSADSPLRSLRHLGTERVTQMVCVFTQRQHSGLGHNKYQCFRELTRIPPPLVRTRDVVALLDGDDKLVNADSLGRVVKRHIEDDCWFTWGGQRGRYSSQSRPMFGGVTVRGHTGENWVFTHMRAMRVGILQRIQMADYCDARGAFVWKMSDCGMIYRAAELAGADHRCFIEGDSVYHYSPDGHAPRSVGAVSKAQYDALAEHFRSMEPSQPLGSLE